MPTQAELDRDAAFSAFTNQVVYLAGRVNAACASMKGALGAGNAIDTAGDTHAKDPGRKIRDYENALEDLKAFIQNRAGQVHNDRLIVTVPPGGAAKHAIRGLEVELVHPVVQNANDPQGKDRSGANVDEYLIKAVI